jgi:ABC-type metal ion transport system substrate-binding protein
MRVFRFILYLLYVENQAKKRKMLQLDAKISPIFDFDADFLMFNKSYLESKNMDKKRRLIRFELCIWIYCIFFVCRESGEKAQNVATGRKNFANF